MTAKLFEMRAVPLRAHDVVHWEHYIGVYVDGYGVECIAEADDRSYNQSEDYAPYRKSFARFFEGLVTLWAS